MIRSLMAVHPINHKLVIASPAQIQIFWEKADQLYYSWEYANHKLTVNFTDGFKTSRSRQNRKQNNR